MDKSRKNYLENDKAHGDRKGEGEEGVRWRITKRRWEKRKET